jgi:hypothetical protein
LALPRAGGAETRDKSDESHLDVARDRWTTRVFIMLPGDYRVYDVVAEPMPAQQGWIVVERRLVAWTGA